jgi:predicted DNA-binding transcriptional regulator AlpA
MKNNNAVRLWTIADVCVYLQCSRSHIYTLMKIDPMFPTPRRLGTAIRFLPTDFEQYVIGHDIEVAK